MAIPNSYANSFSDELYTESSSLSSPPFLRLPAELRNMIYDYVFGDPDLADHQPYPCETGEQIYFMDRSSPASLSRDVEANAISANKRAISLIYTNRQIHAETHLLPYVHSIFRFDGTAPLQRFMDHRSEAQKAAIRYLDIDLVVYLLDSDHDLVFRQPEWIKCLSGMSGMRMIRLNKTGLARSYMVKDLVVDIYNVISASSPDVEIKAEHCHLYCKCRWMMPHEGSFEFREGLMRTPLMRVFDKSRARGSFWSLTPEQGSK